MYYDFEWVSDLAVIPAWECVLVGFALGALVVGAMWFFS